jgi:protein-disulfide isomerase
MRPDRLDAALTRRPNAAIEAFTIAFASAPKRRDKASSAKRLAVFALLAAAAVSGCAAELPSLATIEATDTAVVASQSGATLDTPRFNPFSDALETATTAREVIANPTINDVMQAGELPEMALGRPDAPVTIVEYASLSCPYSRRFHLETFPTLKSEYIDTGKVRFILREFPIGKQSGLATVALRCAPPDKSFALFDRLMSEQPSWVSQEVRPDPIHHVAAQLGLTRTQFDACRQDQRLIARLNWIKERGRKLGVIGTPNFFIQGRLIKSVMGIEELRAIVDSMLPADATPGRPAAR